MRSAINVICEPRLPRKKMCLTFGETLTARLSFPGLDVPLNQFMGKSWGSLHPRDHRIREWPQNLVHVVNFTHLHQSISPPRTPEHPAPPSRQQQTCIASKHVGWSDHAQNCIPHWAILLIWYCIREKSLVNVLESPDRFPIWTAPREFIKVHPFQPERNWGNIDKLCRYSSRIGNWWQWLDVFSFLIFVFKADERKWKSSLLNCKNLFCAT